MKTQNERVLSYLKSGKPLTPLAALKRFKCFRLAARVAELRAEGHPIRSRIVQRGDKRFAAYWL